MIARLLLVVAALAGGISCSDTITCGRGRCPSDSRCVNVFTNTSRKNEGYSTKLLPNVDGEWWCEAPCAGKQTCSGLCLTDPADDNVTVCESTSAEVIYFAPSARLNVPVSGVPGVCVSADIVELSMASSCDDTWRGTPVTCPTDANCTLGRFNAGQTLPDAGLVSSTGRTTVACLGVKAGESLHLSSTLPATKPIRVYAMPESFASCPTTPTAGL